MKLKLGKILEMKEPLARLTNEQLPLKIAFRLNKLIKALDENLNIIESERVKLVQKLGEQNTEGNVQVPKDKIPQFQEEYVELLNEEVEIEFTPFDLEKFENVKITTQDMLKLEVLFE